MEEIIAPVSKELLKAELTEDKRLRMTNKSNNQIYIITHQNAPNVMREIGRLREIAFRAAGGGTGHAGRGYHLYPAQRRLFRRGTERTEITEERGNQHGKPDHLHQPRIWQRRP